MVLPWPLTSLLLAAVASAAVVPSNTSTADDNFQGTLSLRSDDQSQTPIAELVPITDGAQRITINGNPLINTNYTNVGNLTNSAIAYISCNPADYPGFIDAQRVFENAYRKANLSGIILYSTATPYCDYDPGSQQLLQDFPIYSMINPQASADLLDELNSLPVSQKFFVRIQGRGRDNSNNNNNNNGFQQNNPLGPSPSTAVAMIILYSITGIITALFLVIIVTGAIRAHRHPERYGPRNVLGRPRQSRARGLGRAILDTIPIVKFGEKEPPKPTDVELASTAETREATSTTAAGDQANNTAATTPAVTTALSTSDGSQQPSSDNPVSDNHEGIAPAQPASAVATGSKDPSSQDEGLGCSICTEDFEKGQDLRVLPCNHKFHPECVDPWLLNVSGTCPMCRVDLRPVESHDSSASQNPEGLAPPLAAEADASHRRRTAFRDILHFRTRPNATPEERIHALRRLREQRGNRGDTGGDATARSTEEVAEDGRRNKRMSARLSDVFTGRTRRERSPNQQGESSRSGAQQQPTPRDPSPSQSGTPERR